MDDGPNGGLTATTDLIIRVKDVQDKPPFFTGTYRKAINGRITRGTGVIQVNAVDGDSGISNEISYSVLYSSCGDLFAIDNHTGVIYAATNVDINTGIVSQQFGLCVLTIEASEIEMPHQKQYGYTTTSTNVTLILLGVTYNTLPSVSPACNNAGTQYTTTNTSPPTNIPLSCKEDWDFDNPCNKSNVLKGVTKFPHPDSIYKFLICDVSGKTFSAQCPKNEVFHADCSLCALPNQTFSKLCTISNKMFRNPCSKENIIAGNLTFPHPDSTNKYIRCDSRGNAWEEECFSGSFWDQTQMICVLPEAFNPCHNVAALSRHFILTTVILAYTSSVITTVIL
ncbi:cadherin-24-like isoform X2 [Ruditapes philippinarum]|uniref:cadherin-24-like isoform X2 n=1 Tax=Ruditapes philippinarum TaxID=129788 RepID=UPI00295A8509|nr:cadherin-24-like isoform X2 [Ruditapes philippinarum]